jgi:hypothetical protein
MSPVLPEKTSLGSRLLVIREEQGMGQGLAAACFVRGHLRSSSFCSGGLRREVLVAFPGKMDYSIPRNHCVWDYFSGSFYL